MTTPASGIKWPLTGGVPSQLSTTKDKKTEMVYLAGYSDGSVRIWDATFPVLSFVCLLDGQVSLLSFSFIIYIRKGQFVILNYLILLLGSRY